MEKSRNEGKNPSQENLNRKSNLESNQQKDPRDTSTKGREEQVISQKNQTVKSDPSKGGHNERSESSRSGITTDSKRENISDRNSNSNPQNNSTQNISSSNKEKGFREGQQDNQTGLESDTEIPKIGKDDAEKTQRETPKM